MHNDPHSYLHGIFKNVSKGQEAAEKRVVVNGHSRSMPKRTTAGGSTGVQAPDNRPNPAMVGPASHKKLAETAPGAATVASRKKSGAKASSATHEAGESAAYEKMEEKTLKGLKGPKSKILKEGHNTSGVIARPRWSPNTGVSTVSGRAGTSTVPRASRPYTPPTPVRAQPTPTRPRYTPPGARRY